MKLRVPESILPVDEFFYKHLYVFRNLGPKKVIQCLATVCPLIVYDCKIINMEYQLTFLEFFETIIFCAFMMADEEKQKEIELIELEKEKERALLIESEVLVEVQPQKAKKKEKAK